MHVSLFFFFFQAEDGIRDKLVTGVQTCALPISTATQAPSAGFGSCCMNINVVHYTFSGAPAHQLQAWDGRDALMGVIELFNHIDGLRKTLRPEAKVQGIITEGGKAPNVVPDRAVAEFWIRYPDPVYLAQRLTQAVDEI